MKNGLIGVVYRRERISASSSAHYSHPSKTTGDHARLLFLRLCRRGLILGSRSGRESGNRFDFRRDLSGRIRSLAALVRVLRTRGGGGDAVACQVGLELTTELVRQGLGLPLAELPPCVQLDDPPIASGALDAMNLRGKGVKSVLFDGGPVEGELREQLTLFKRGGRRPNRDGADAVGGLPHDEVLPSCRE